MIKLYVQYGCGLCAPGEWVNFDASPTLRIQKTSLLGRLLRKQLNAIFPDNVKYGDVLKGLPIEDNSCDGIYCSHVLEHMALNDFRVALKNTHRLLKVNGIFRCVVPDLAWAAKTYLDSYTIGNSLASVNFMDETLLGIRKRPRSLKELLGACFGNSHHLWMWDDKSISQELAQYGFREIRRCNFNDCEDTMFKLVEGEGRFKNAVAMECKK